MDKIKVVLVDDLKILTHSLKLVMEKDPEIEVMACFESVVDAVKFCSTDKPDVILMDLIMPNVDGLDGAKMIKEIDEDIRIIIMTGSEAEDHFVRAMGCCVIDGYLLKTIVPAGLIHCIKSVYYGVGLVDKKILNKYGMKYFNFNDADAYSEWHLTKREIEVLERIIKGMSNGEIGLDMNISEGTVRNIVSELLNKFQVKNRINLVIKATGVGTSIKATDNLRPARNSQVKY